MFYVTFMRTLRKNKALFVIVCTVVIVLGTVNHFSNISDLLFYHLPGGSQTLLLSLQCNGGRLGNQMCSYASLYGLSVLNNRRAFLTLSCNLKHLKPYFQGPSAAPSIHPYFYFKSHPWKISSYLNPEDDKIPNNSNFIAGYEYPCSYTFFDHVRDEIRREFSFHEDIQAHARRVLVKTNVHLLENVTYVGVHVRRGDYKERWLNIFEGVPVNMEYFHQAFAYFRRKYSPVIFVVVSDDRAWCVQNLSGHLGLHIAEDAPTPAHDLAVLANCNHTVMTYGTFGFWGAYLAGGEVVYFDKFLKANTSFTINNFVFDKMYPSHWKGIVTVNVTS